MILDLEPPRTDDTLKPHPGEKPLPAWLATIADEDHTPRNPRHVAIGLIAVLAFSVLCWAAVATVLSRLF